MVFASHNDSVYSVFLKFSRAEHHFNIPEIQRVTVKSLLTLLSFHHIKDAVPVTTGGYTHEHGPASTFEGQGLRSNSLPLNMQRGLPWWLRRERVCLQYRRSRFDPWFGKIPCRTEWLPIPVFLSGELHGQRSLAGYSPWGCKESDMTEAHTQICREDSSQWHSAPLNQLC